MASFECRIKGHSLFKKILIANRGEIACRIGRTCRKLGIAAATVHSVADRDALHVREIGESIEIGAAQAGASYLRIDRIVDAARRIGADAVHPGYGFLAENAEFATALGEAGIAFIGPSADTLVRFGDKAAAKAEARAVGMPVIAGTEEPSASVAEIVRAISRMQFPVLLKAAAGGGGKGMRVATSSKTLVADIEAATREAVSAFGNPNLIVEQYLPDSRHIEVQILGDGNGNVIHLLDRECSLQRRHQKIVEEAPVLSLADELRQGMFDHAVRLGKAVSYRGLGTVEFIVKDDNVYFLEVNPRIQVEHPITEEIIGFDLVELQIRAVSEGRLPIAQKDVEARAVSVEARLYAEDPELDFLPSTGRIELIVLPTGLRIDSGIAAGMTVTQFYDPMLAKLIATGPTRADAYAQLDAALRQTAVVGVRTNLPLLRRLVTAPEVLANDLHTGSIKQIATNLGKGGAVTRREAAIAAAFWLRTQRMDREGAWAGWGGLTGWRLSCAESVAEPAPSLRLIEGDTQFEVGFGSMRDGEALPVTVDGETFAICLESISGGLILAQADGVVITVSCFCGSEYVGFIHGSREVALRVEPFLSGTLLSSGESGDGQVLAPMTGQIIAVDIEPGAIVAAGDRLGLLESMKMELDLRAPKAGMISSVLCRAGDTVERDQCIFLIGAGKDTAP